MTAAIDLPSGGNIMSFDRQRLRTAILVYLDAPGGDRVKTSMTLRQAHGFHLDAIVYAVAAADCVETGIEP